ncbi:hypothetical protein ACWD4N_48405 [Streptomyces sp. NPDC002586]
MTGQPRGGGQGETRAIRMPQCPHVIAHWVTGEDHEQITAAIDYARGISDAAALPLLLARLTQPCQARDEYQAQQNQEGS